MTDRYARLAVIVTAALQILVPMLPLLGIGETIGEMSNDVRTLITPAGWAFSIWGPLYFGSAAFALYQMLPAGRQSPLVRDLRWPAAAAFAGNAAWAGYVQFNGTSYVSSVIIAVTLAALIVAYARIARTTHPFSRAELWLACVPLSALAAWLTVATGVNIAASLRFHGYDLFASNPASAMVALVFLGALGALAVFAGRGNLPFALTFAWAMVGICAAGGQTSTPVLLAAIAAIAAIAVAVVAGWRKRTALSRA